MQLILNLINSIKSCFSKQRVWTILELYFLFWNSDFADVFLIIFFKFWLDQSATQKSLLALHVTSYITWVVILLHGLDIIMLDNPLQNFKLSFAKIWLIPWILNISSEITNILFNALNLHTIFTPPNPLLLFAIILYKLPQSLTPITIIPLIMPYIIHIWYHIMNFFSDYFSWNDVLQHQDILFIII